MATMKIQYRIICNHDKRRSTKWKDTSLILYPEGFTPDFQYRFKRQLENDLRLYLSDIELRLV